MPFKNFSPYMMAQNAAHARILVVGKTGGGKTVALMHIARALSRRTDMVIGFSGVKTKNSPFHEWTVTREEAKRGLPPRIPFNAQHGDYLENLDKMEGFKEAVVHMYDKYGFKKAPRSMMVVTDSSYSKKVFRDRNMRWAIMDGRQVGLKYVLVDSQYINDVDKSLREMFDYVMLTMELSKKNRKYLYESVAGVFETFEEFDKMMKQFTSNHCLMVIKRSGNTYNPEDCVFRFKPDFPPRPFVLGNDDYRRKCLHIMKSKRKGNKKPVKLDEDGA